MRTTRSGQQGQRTRRAALAAFTLLELLVVIGIIGILTYITLPALPGLKGGNVLSAASRQLMDDLALARQRAIAERTTVYMVFVPRETGLWTLGAPATKQMNNLLAGQWTDYAIYATRTVGDQPGWTRSRYLTEWKSLPEDVFIPGWKFSNTFAVIFPQATNFPITVDPFSSNVNFRVPDETSGYTYRLPYIAFNSQGQVTSSQDEFIPLARGSVFPLQRDAFGSYPTQFADILESPPFNSTNTPHLIRISWLTGRAKVEQPQLP